MQSSVYHNLSIKIQIATIQTMGSLNFIWINALLIANGHSKAWKTKVPLSINSNASRILINSNVSALHHRRAHWHCILSCLFSSDLIQKEDAVFCISFYSGMHNASRERSSYRVLFFNFHGKQAASVPHLLVVLRLSTLLCG